MRGQKGGSLTKNGKTLTAEQMLDKFTATYLDKDTINLNPTQHTILKEFNDILSEKKLHELFNADNNLVLEDEYLNFDEIEKRIYMSIAESGLNTTGKPKMTIPKILYNIVKVGRRNDGKIEKQSPVFLLDHPYIEKNSTTDKWTLFVKKDGSYIHTGLEEEGKTYEEVLNKLLCNNKSYEIKSYPGDFPLASITSSLKNNDAFMEILEEHLNDFNTMRRPKKLWFNIKKNKENNTVFNVFYVEQDRQNPNKYHFHPHNFINFLPSSSIEKTMKQLYNDIAKRLSELFEDCAYKYLISPERFYHIHVTKIPNEEDILLTCHAMFEELSVIDDKPSNNKKKNNDKITNTMKKFQDFTYESPNGDTFKLSRPIIYRRPSPNLNTSYNSEIRKKFRRAHNYYILLKPDTSSHPIYKISQNNQFGNPFLIQDQSFIDGDPSAPTPFDQKLVFIPAIAEASLGHPLFDINHIKGKGVMLGLRLGPCTVLCDTVDNDFEYREKTIRALFNPNLSTPLTANEIEEHMYKDYKNLKKESLSNHNKKVLNTYYGVGKYEPEEWIPYLKGDSNVYQVISGVEMLDDDEIIKELKCRVEGKTKEECEQQQQNGGNRRKKTKKNRKSAKSTRKHRS
jgi:hypothetical protein